MGIQHPLAPLRNAALVDLLLVLLGVKDTPQRGRASGRKVNALLKSSRAPHASRTGRREAAWMLLYLAQRGGTRRREGPGV